MPVIVAELRICPGNVVGDQRSSVPSTLVRFGFKIKKKKITDHLYKASFVLTPLTYRCTRYIAIFKNNRNTGNN